MKKILIAAVMLFAFGVNNSNSQDVVKQGNTFTQVSNKKSSDSSEKETKTEYTYRDTKGNEYPIYLSSTGKAFIKKVSKKTGKEYRQYLPEVGKRINPDAYKDK